MNRTNAVYIAWQAPDTHEWHVVGSLQERNAGYVFNYTKGVLASAMFTRFSGMNDIYETYVSEELFPLFKNRLLSSRRPEYPRFIKWLGLDEKNAQPIEILARSGGKRSTDQLQMFKKIEADDSGYFEHYFFAHGLGHMSESVQARIVELQKGDELLMSLDVQNRFDKHAVIIRVDCPAEILGFCPRYFSSDIKRLLLDESSGIKLTVEKISDDAPYNYRLLCKLTGRIKLPVNGLDANEEFQLMTKA
jgi:hypothetical protein